MTTVPKPRTEKARSRGKAEDGVRIASRDAQRELREGPLEGRDSRAGAGGDGDDGSIFEEGVLGEASDLMTHGFEPVRLNGVLLGDDHDAVSNAKQSADGEVFGGSAA